LISSWMDLFLLDVLSCLQVMHLNIQESVRKQIAQKLKINLPT